jgi:predicted RNA-binding protein with PIN domain
MVEKFKPYTLPREKATELAKHRQNLIDALAEYDKLEECGVDCQRDRAEFENEIERIDKVLGGFGPAPVIKDGTR